MRLMGRMYIHGGDGMGRGEGRGSAAGRLATAPLPGQVQRVGAAKRHVVLNRCSQCGDAAACTPPVPKGQTKNTTNIRVAGAMKNARSRPGGGRGHKNR